MTVFSKIQSFFYRNRHKFFIGGVTIVGSIFLVKYAKCKLRDWQEKETMEFLERNRKQSHFESLNRTCNQTLLSLSSSLIDVICHTVNTDDLIENIKRTQENKIVMWNQLKKQVFVKASLMIYSIVILALTLKIQLNIVGGYLYKDPGSVTTEVQEHYLSLCQNFLNSGVAKLSKVIENELNDIIDNLDLKKQLKLGDVEAIFWSLQSSLASRNNSPTDHLKDYIFQYDVDDADSIYNSMLQDTADFLDSDEVKFLATHCVNRGFTLLGDQLAEFFTNETKITEISGDSFQNPFETKKPLAKLLPIINGLFVKQAFPQTLIHMLASNEKLHTLGANIYESLL